jgi:hypothetical protein
MHPPTRTVDVDDDGVMNHAVNDGGGDDGISQIIAQLFKIDICRYECGALAVTAVDDLEKKGSVSGWSAGWPTTISVVISTFCAFALFRSPAKSSSCRMQPISFSASSLLV